MNYGRESAATGQLKIFLAFCDDVHRLNVAVKSGMLA
jgi:hypothetical protein